jgi:hypothetical protein
MITYYHENSSGVVHNMWMDTFNSFIVDTAVREIKRGGSRYTWINKHKNPVMSNLDRFFVSKEWEQKYPKVFVRTLVRVGSDRNPILLNDGVDSVQRQRLFRFEKAWLLIEKWPKRMDEEVRSYWKRMKKTLRQLSKGMRANLDS